MKDIYNEILYPFQKKAVDLSNKSKQLGIFYDMGLGKTLISESIAQVRNKKKILVLCPSSKLFDWKEDIEEDLGLDAIVLDGTAAKDLKALNNYESGAIVVNYQKAWRRPILDMIDEDWIVICDEAHYLNNHKSKIGKWMQDIALVCKDILLLTGTPVTNGDIRQWYNLLKILGSKISYNKFIGRYAIMELQTLESGRRFPKYIGSIHTDELHNSIGAKSISMKSSEAITLPDQIITDIKLKHDKPNIYKQMRKMHMYKNLAIPTKGVRFLRSRQFASGFIEEYKNVSLHKKVALKQLLESNENSMLLFYNFNSELEDIREVVESLGMDLYQINGAVKDVDKIDHSRKFLVAGQYKSASAGINMQYLNNTIYYSPPLSSVEYSQSLARTNRIGQKKHCFYYRFITKGTLESDIYKTLEKGEDYTVKMFESVN